MRILLEILRDEDAPLAVYLRFAGGREEDAFKGALFDFIGEGQIFEFAGERLPRRRGKRKRHRSGFGRMKIGIAVFLAKARRQEETVLFV